MKKDKKKERVLKLRHNSNFKKRMEYLLEMTLTLPIGAITGFIFERRMVLAVIALGFFFILFLIYCVIIVVEENKVSVLSIMSEGLKDGRYEEVIKFGSAMSPTLFTSNKNFDRVKLGRLLLEACQSLAKSEHSARDNIVIASGGSRKTVKQIKTELLLDDLGWSLYLTDQGSSEATNNIQEAIKQARFEIKRLKNQCKNNPEREVLKNIEIYMRLILRGYRHLTGIYYSSQKTFDLARNYERITYYILSGGNILAMGGVCSSKITNNDSVCGLLCSKSNDRINCITRNIKELFFNEQRLTGNMDISDYIDFHQVKISVSDLIDDMKCFDSLSAESKERILKESSYAWSRNIVKWLQRNIHSSWDASSNVMFEDNLSHFISDEERICKVSESIAFARLYYYGKSVFDNQDLNDFDGVINTHLIKTEQQRYLTLVNEISLVNYETSFVMGNFIGNIYDNETHNATIELLIDRIKQTRETCRGLRADLFARNTSFLMKAMLIQYNMNVRYNMGDESTITYRRDCIKEITEEAERLYKEVVSYEHCENEDVKNELDLLISEMKIASKEIQPWRFLRGKGTVKIVSDTKVKREISVDSSCERKIKEIRARWKVT